MTEPIFQLIIDDKVTELLDDMILEIDDAITEAIEEIADELSRQTKNNLMFGSSVHAYKTGALMRGIHQQKYSRWGIVILPDVYYAGYVHEGMGYHYRPRPFFEFTVDMMLPEIAEIVKDCVTKIINLV